MGSKIDEIDDSLYSRQRYVLGENAMKKMAQSDVFLVGVGGIGIEIAKNLVLAGVRSLTLHDYEKATMMDLGTQFFLRTEDVTENRTRAEASIQSLADLNPYVTIYLSSQELNLGSDLTFLRKYDCVIITGKPLDLLLEMNKFCRNQQPIIKFIIADVFGLHSYVFCDFGDAFNIVDPYGEEPKQFLISAITKDLEGYVIGFDENRHEFQDGDIVTFKEIEGMTALNGCQRKITVESPFAFTIGDLTGEEFETYLHGGIAVQVKVSQTTTFKSLEVELMEPSADVVDYSKDPQVSHLAIHTLLHYMSEEKRLPKPWSHVDAKQLIDTAGKLNQKRSKPLEKDFTQVVQKLAYTANGCLGPLAAAMGGIVAQEVLKALSGKFIPINQWMFIDASELMVDETVMSENCFDPMRDRYEALRICLGEDILKHLANTRIFMVGSGAIGCELMKNFALLGIGSAGNGSITVTDDDLIEKSNLNRQFLFRAHHIQKPKSTTAAAAAMDINQALTIQAHQIRVCRDTELTHFGDTFLKDIDIVVNAVDNIPARIYMDRRCVMNKKPLIDSGTIGTVGHVQVIIPDVSETYESHDDSGTTEVAHCTLKSFPSTSEHTIQWAKDKFQSLFSLKPTEFNTFWSEHESPTKTLEKLKTGFQPENNTMPVLKLTKNKPKTWKECVSIARLKFEKYFNHKAKFLLYLFPADAKTKDGDAFWQSPRRRPSPLEFDENNDIHMMFILSTARLYAATCDLTPTATDTSKDTIIGIVESVEPPAFSPKNKTITTDDSVTKKDEERQQGYASIDECLEALQSLMLFESTNEKMTPLEFEKDDDSNGHIDFITSTSNLRAQMYGIEPADRYKTKLIAGRIIPAIATTTATVAAFVTQELIRYVKGTKRDDYRNCFLNLGRSIVEFCQPGEPMVIEINPGLSFTQWDVWHVQGNPNFTLQDFIQHFLDKYNVTVNLILQEKDMVYEPLIPMYREKLPNKMTNLLQQTKNLPYVELTVLFKSEDLEKDEDIPGPPVRYHLHA